MVIFFATALIFFVCDAIFIRRTADTHYSFGYNDGFRDGVLSANDHYDFDIDEDSDSDLLVEET